MWPGESGAEARPAAPHTALPATIDLLDAWPELEASVPSEELQVAHRTLVVRAVVVEDADVFDVLGPMARSALSFLVVDGIVLKATSFGGRSAVELLGPGDLLAAPLSATRQIESPAVSRFLGHGRATVAVLDERFRRASRRWPGMSDCLHERLARQTHRVSRHLAILHLPRVEDRIVALFVDFAERFGRVTSDGIVIDLPLTHQLIGDLVGSRRPTVSLALHTLADSGTLDRRDGSRWHLASSALER